MESFIGMLVVGFVIMGSILLYLLPAIVASRNSHPQKTAIILLNILAGWSGILWIVALVWAVIKPQPQQVVVVHAPPLPIAAQ